MNEKNIGLTLLVGLSVISLLTLSACGAPVNTSTPKGGNTATASTDEAPPVALPLPEISPTPVSPTPVTETFEQAPVGDVELVAAKEDAVFRLPRSVNIKVPHALEVSVKHSGKAYLFFGEMACEYKTHGKDKTNYEFKVCTDAKGNTMGVGPGDLIATDGVITLHAHQNHGKETLVVRVTLEILD